MGVTARRCTVVAGRHRTPSAATSEQVRKFRCLPHQGGGLCRTLFSTAIYDPNHSFFARRDTPYTTRGDGWTLQIGPAPCRERVCQYVYISAGAVSLKQHNQEQYLKPKREKRDN